LEKKKLDAGMWGPVVGTYYPKHKLTRPKAVKDINIGVEETNRAKAVKTKEKLNLTHTTLCDKFYTRLAKNSPLKIIKDKEKQIEEKEKQL